ncbi:FKBP-type peptidyl-prolyl cis-trans isomerase [Phaeocystidibacter luteus]|uniref:Peptidyl-prolyl cis-trans isomerase n=1 Tax=Phaeocystidibacter luteus TaxID=911197 RepID=A0A6N6RHW8_9FLAO|nr:FKBP-type peptidyl-prolyl cis-trans isomerase [Phaeocystidibacter luteus]KAB2813912.1 peptidylprolyl isomerase [Phaeocystidibacter luteus]
MVKRIAPHTIVELKYDMREGGPKGDLLERMDANYPLKFYFGAGTMLPAFEQALDGLREGEQFSFSLIPSEGYGEMDSSKIVEVSAKYYRRDPWFNEENVNIGDRMVFLNPTTGKEELGTVTEVLSDSLLVDFNHALAGKVLHFSGTILYVRPPRKEEKDSKRYVEPDGLRMNQNPQDE